MPVIDRTDFLARKPPLMTVNNGSTSDFTDASRVFELNVWNREANPPAGGRGCVKTTAFAEGFACVGSKF
jgi:hypothetical protein